MGRALHLRAYHRHHDDESIAATSAATADPEHLCGVRDAVHDTPRLHGEYTAMTDPDSDLRARLAEVLSGHDCEKMMAVCRKYDTDVPVRRNEMLNRIVAKAVEPLLRALAAERDRLCAENDRLRLYLEEKTRWHI